MRGALAQHPNTSGVFVMLAISWEPCAEQCALNCLTAIPVMATLLRPLPPNSLACVIYSDAVTARKNAALTYLFRQINDSQHIVCVVQIELLRYDTLVFSFQAWEIVISIVSEENCFTVVFWSAGTEKLSSLGKGYSAPTLSETLRGTKCTGEF